MSACSKSDDGACCVGTSRTGPVEASDVSPPLSFQSLSGEDDIQGFDEEFDPPLENKYECPICLMGLREPVQTPCGHRFCKACILRSMREAGYKCPVDNEVLQECHLFPDNFAKREILSLTVRCRNQPCKVEVELRSLEEHLSRCNFSSVCCLRCEENVWRKDFGRHEQTECPKRVVTCSLCCEKMTYDEEQGHTLLCPYASVQCEFCTEEMLREHLKSHQEDECSRAPVSCTFSYFGCTSRMLRLELGTHMHECMQVHMDMMASTLISLWTSSSVPCSDAVLRPSCCSCSDKMQELREMVRAFDSKVVMQGHKMLEVQTRCETQHRMLGEQSVLLKESEGRISELEARCCGGTYLWRVERFSRLRGGVGASGDAPDCPAVQHSPGFYTGVPGYRLCLRLQISPRLHVGSSSPEQLPANSEPYLSLFTHLMQGDFDDLLPWPFQGRIRLSVLDQSERSERHDMVEIMEAEPHRHAFQRPTSMRNPKGYGYLQFMPLSLLGQRAFLKDDVLIVRCEVETIGMGFGARDARQQAPNIENGQSRPSNC
uniref:TNF receptor-associated factor 6 n=1 Tax=Myxine glutinosa TaxID=7769 RepID=UPI00358EF99E